jgi:hypothetical protein
MVVNRVMQCMYGQCYALHVRTVLRTVCTGSNDVKEASQIMSRKGIEIEISFNMTYSS